MLATNSSVSFTNAWRSASSNGKITGSGCTVSTLRRCSHCPAKLEMSASARGSASMRRTCCCEHSRILQPAPFRQVEQLVVGNAAPQEEREPRRELEIADADRPCPASRAPDRARRGTGTPATRAAPRARAECRCRSRPPPPLPRLRRARSGPSRRTRTAARCRRASPDAGTRAARACVENRARARRALAVTVFAGRQTKIFARLGVVAATGRRCRDRR